MQSSKQNPTHCLGCNNTFICDVLVLDAHRANGLWEAILAIFWDITGCICRWTCRDPFTRHLITHQYIHRTLHNKYNKASQNSKGQTLYYNRQLFKNRSYRPPKNNCSEKMHIVSRLDVWLNLPQHIDKVTPIIKLLKPSTIRNIIEIKAQKIHAASMHT